MEKKVGINQRISINVMEMAMKAALDGCFTPEYAADLASGEYQGENRINKARSIIGKLHKWLEYRLPPGHRNCSSIVLEGHDKVIAIAI